MKKKQAAKAQITSPVRFYLFMLFAAVAGIGLYLVTLQRNTDYDTNQGSTAQYLKSTPKPTATPKATSAAKTTFNATEEAASLDLGMSSTDFDTSSLDDALIGL
jgi:hypothetical protein